LKSQACGHPDIGKLWTRTRIKRDEQQTNKLIALREGREARGGKNGLAGLVVEENGRQRDLEWGTWGKKKSSQERQRKIGRASVKMRGGIRVSHGCLEIS